MCPKCIELVFYVYWRFKIEKCIIVVLNLLAQKLPWHTSFKKKKKKLGIQRASA